MKNSLFYSLGLVLFIVFSFTSCKKPGCIDQNAKNYDADAKTDDGSCIYAVKGCTDPTAKNYNAAAEENDGTCEYYLASSEVQKKTALLEDFTGVRCTWCPVGHRFSEAYKDNNPGKMIIIATQSSSSYGVPYPNQPDLRTSFASQLETNAGYGTPGTGYPGGTINREIFSGNYVYVSGKMAISLTAGYPATTAAWWPAPDDIISQDAPVNIGIKTTYDEGTRVVSIEVETYYTSDISETLYMNIAITESGITATQIDLGVLKSDYIHNDVLRTYVTGQWGEEITTETTTGTRTNATYEHTLDSEWDASNCHVVVFVSEYKKSVKNAAEIEVIAQ